AISANGGFSAPYFQAEYVQSISDFNACLINPALLFRVNQLRGEVGIYRWGGYVPSEDLGYQQISFLMPYRLKHTIGISFIGSGSQFNTSIINPETSLPKETGVSDFWENWIIGHYSYFLLPWFTIGINPKVVFQDQFNTRIRYGAGMDLGFYFNLFDHYRFGDMGISAVMQDIIPANIKWRHGIDGSKPSKQLMTTRFRGGLRYSLFNDELVADGEGVVDNLFQDLWKTLIDLSEKSFFIIDSSKIDSTGKKIYDTIPMKSDRYLNKIGRYSCHVRYQWIPQIWLKAGWANNNIPYLGFNFNVIYPMPEMTNYLNIDVHFGYSLSDEDRGPTGMVKLSSDFGPTREQRESKRLFERLVLEPMNAYNEAMRLYTAHKYWDAAFAFGKVLSLFPNFHLNDKATYYMGDCYTQLYLHDIARDVFKDGLAEYTTSEMRSKFMYGLQLIDYREGNTKEALKNHAFIENLYAESDIRPDADYLAGEIYFMQKNYNAAHIVLSKILPRDKVYKYAQYTLAAVNIETNKLPAALQNLSNIVADSAGAAADENIYYAAVVKLGLLYYEQVELRKAVEILRKVPEYSDQADDALLGIAWSWIRANRPEECLSTIERLISRYSSSPYLPEAYLLKGYAFMLLKRNSEALVALNECLRQTRRNFATKDDLNQRKDVYKEYLIAFAPVATQIKKNALRKVTDKSLSERDQLKSDFSKYDKETADLFQFSITVKDNDKFFMQKDKIVSDAEYAIATVTKLINTEKDSNRIQKGIKKQEQIESEIQKLENQLDNMKQP
ncbi:MAG: tetratricopeptide repeat protein, partial [Chitinivibrionales bacterium]|nr:tetratricopeptide repeat protein [Chitinivibrionales bacterium]